MRRRCHRCARPTAALVTLALVAVLGLAGSGCGTSTGPDSSGKAATISSVKLKPSDIGAGWKLEKEVTADPSRASIDSNLGLLAGLGASRVLNQIFVNGSERLQVNLVQLPSGDKAGAAALLMSDGGSGNLYGTKGSVAVEVISSNSTAKARAFKALGAESVDDRLTGDTGALEPGKPRKVSFDLACVLNIDYMKANDLSNYLGSYQEGQPVDPAMQAIISSTTFGDTLRLLTSSGKSFKAEYSFQPAGAKLVNSEYMGVTTFTFDPASLKKKAGVPYVSVSGTIHPVSTDLENGDGASLTAEQVQSLMAGTSFWPTSDATVQAAMKEAVGTAKSDSEKIQSVWRWVRDNIKYSGPPGTRYGTVKVLEQRFGRCWDKADVFVTLCRASGVPAREVAGWLVDESGGAGHVWAQAYLAGKGWVSVDCTSDRVGAGSDYLPFFATFDGAMPILYVKMPTID
jgi:hypothetical protein